MSSLRAAHDQSAPVGFVVLPRVRVARRVIARPVGLPESFTPDVDLGGDVYVEFTHWSLEHHPDAPNPSGGFLIHRRGDSPTGWCAGGFHWWQPPGEVGRPSWTLNSLDPLDLSPSFRCHCGFHGFIRRGRWVLA